LGIALALVVAAGAALAAKAPPKTAPAPPVTAPVPPPAPDDSSAAAHSLLLTLRPQYGGIDNWARLGGVRYFVTYRIAGPDSTTVREWTESYMVWTHDSPRIRIDNGEDSTAVVVTGDSTFVRRGGVWVTDPAVTLPARNEALDEVWLMRLPWNIIDYKLKRRVEPAFAPGQPLSLRVEYGPGLDRPAGTRLFLRFDPPTYALRSMRWYDPRTRNWYLMEFADEGRRYGWMWSNRRVLRSSDSAGTPGPIVWTALVQDMQLETFMPTEVLAPPGAAAFVARPDSAAAGWGSK
jgi:hypothetical protein